MKAPESQETADNTEQLARRESSEPSRNPANTNYDSVSFKQAGLSLPCNLLGFEDQACSLTTKAHGPIAWAKTLQVIYCEEPQV